MKVTTVNIREYFSGKGKKVKIALGIFFTVGVVGLILPVSRNLFIQLTPLAILLSSGALVLFHRPVYRQSKLPVFLIIFIAGYLIEVAGVKTGWLFGSYTYGNGLGIKLFETPVIIGVNWLVLIYCTYAITDHLSFPESFRIILSSLLMVSYDAVMEQVAPHLDMWSFEGDAVPIRNYLAWFATALFLHSLLKLSGIKYENSISTFVFTLQLVFFIILTIAIRING